jgi:plastocyanin
MEDGRLITCESQSVDIHSMSTVSVSGSTPFRSLPVGTSVTRTFNRRGTFRYYCTIHGNVVNGVCSGMCGRIVVS